MPSVTFGPLLGFYDGDDGGAPMKLPHYKRIVRTLDNSPVRPYLDPLVALHISGKSLTLVEPSMT